MCNDIFTNCSEQLDIIKDWNLFSMKIDKLKPYMDNFDKNNIIKARKYFNIYMI